MVFESLVADLLNRFLGDYIENLDSKQLNVGIWGGDVVLRNLDIRPTALDSLDLPLKLKSGSLGSLTLKIPWKNLYTEAVLATIEDLYIVATPNLGIKYDAVKEEKQADDTKQRELQRIEEQRKEKRKKPDAAEAQKQDTFAEKLTTQVIKNLQVTIRNIHVRYEDEYTNPKRPFAMGITLDSLVFQTTDEHWQPRVVKETVKMFYKIVDLDNLAMYWNSGTELVSRIEDKMELKRVMKEMIATKSGGSPKNFNYMLSPISVSARLVMNPKPEVDGYRVPKILLTVAVQELGFHIGKYQYQDILEFLEAQERLTLNAKFRKYRPNLREYKGHSKEWWHFSMNAIMEEQVRRKSRNWSWQHIKEHRDLVRNYKNAWIEKQTNRSPGHDTNRIIEQAEKDLDVFNLNVARQQAELTIDRKKLKRVEEQTGVINWVKSWWGGGGNQASSEEDIATQFEKAMTPEERGKLYQAIDYQENQTPTSHPKEYVENKVAFTLENLMVVVDDDVSEKEKMEAMILSWQHVSADFEQRPSANAIKLDAKMETFKVEGIRGDDGKRPIIMSHLEVSERKKGTPQIVLGVETNPLDGTFDQLVKFHAQPLSVVYHAASVNKLAEVFRPPESVRLKALAAAAFAKYEDIRERSAAGLQYALEKRTVLKLDIEILPTIIQIPTRGVMENSSNVLVVDLGTLNISTEDVSKVQADDEFYRKKEEEKLDILRDSAYDKFKVELKTLQILFARPEDNWHVARTKQHTTDMHFLKPTGWKILLEKAAIDDLRLPKIRVSGHLPDLFFTASDSRLLDIFQLLLSIPTPPPGPEPVEPTAMDEEREIEEPTTRNRAKMKAILEDTGDAIREEDDEGYDSEKPAEEEEAATKATAKPTKVNNEQIQVELKMVLNQFAVSISQMDGQEAKPYMNLSVTTIAIGLEMRPLDMHAAVSLGGMEVQHMKYHAPDKPNDPVYILENPKKKEHSDAPLLYLDYKQADKKSPFFESKFHRIEQLVAIRGQPLNVILHQEAFVDVQGFFQTLQTKLDELKPPQPPASLEPPKLKRSSSQVSTASSTKSTSSRAKEAAAKAVKKTRTEKNVDERITNMKLEATFSGLYVLIVTSKQLLSVISMEDLSTSVSMKPKAMEAVVSLKKVGISNPATDTVYDKILAVAGEEVFKLRYVQHIRTEEEKKRMAVSEFDMEVFLSVAEMRFVFLNIWLQRMLAWLAPFQEAATVAAEQAGAAMQEGARNAAEVLKEIQHTTRIMLEVSIHAPVIIIPQSSKSDEAFLADFGDLIVANKFTSRRGGKADAYFDNMTVRLDKMKLSRVVLGQDRWTVAAECQILEPVSFELTVVRNLSFSYFKDEPEMKIIGKLPLLKVTASREDYGVAMKTLTGNLAEGVPQAQQQAKKKEGTPAPPKTPATPASPISPVASQQQLQLPQRDSRDHLKVQATVESSAPHVAQPKVSMEFSFEIEKIIAQLYDGSSNLMSGVAKRDPAFALAAIEIQMISAKGRMLDNGAMAAHVFLLSFIMDDQRSGRTGITRLMDKKGYDKENMIDIKYTVDSASNQEANIHMRPFSLYVSAEFLGALARFFIVTKTEAELTEERNQAQILEMQQGSQAAAPTEQKPTAQQPVVTSPVPPPAAGKMKVRVLVEEPEMVLLEDAKQTENTQAIILKFSAEASLDQTPETMEMSGKIKGFEVTSGNFDKSKRDKNVLRVLSSLDVNFSANTPKGAGQQYNVEVTPVKIRISPTVIRLLSAVAANMAVAPEQSAREKEAAIQARQHVWDRKNLADCNFWFLNDVLRADEAVEQLFTPIEELVFDDSKEDKCEMKVETIEITLEADGGAGTVPMIYLTSSFSADVREWTRQLRAESTLTLEMWYYNERFNVWEPLIEPIVDEEGTKRPWQIEAYVMTQNEYDTADIEVIRQPPRMTIAIVATDNMQITVTKTLLDLTSELGDAFARAAKLVEPQPPKGISVTYPWSIRNVTSERVEVLESATFKPDDAWTGNMPQHQELELISKVKSKEIGSQDDKMPMMLTLNLPTFNTYREVNVARSEKRIFALPKTTHPGDQWHFVVDTISQFGKKLVTIRSPIKFMNHLPLHMNIFYRHDGNIEADGVVEAEGGEFSPKLEAVHTASGELLIQPDDERYSIGREAISWRDIHHDSNWHAMVECPSVDGDPAKSYFVQASVEIEDAYLENTHHRDTKTPCYLIHLGAPTLLRNALPFPVEISAQGMQPQILKGGEAASLWTVVPGRSISLKVQSEPPWTCELLIEKDFEELTQHTFHSRDLSTSSKLEMDLGLRTARRCGTQEMTLYSPFWMVNKTGKKLSYQSDKYLSVFDHAPDSDEPRLFTFSGDTFFKKNKKALLKVEDSSWSKEFPLDVVGSAGRVSCDKGTMTYEVSVNIQLSNSGLTKIVTFTPFYLIDNRTGADVEVRQAGIESQKIFATIPKQQCAGFLPEKKQDVMQMACRYLNTNEESQAFCFTKDFESLVTMPNDYVGVYVTTHVTENSVVVQLEKYEEGMAPVLLVNNTEGFEVYFRQKDVDHIEGLPPQQCALFSWTSVLMPRTLLWTVGEAKNVPNDLMKDDMGEATAQKDVKVYWVSFLNGRQRILLFTQDLAIATTASKPYELERIDQQFTVSLQAVNVSLVNNLVGREIASAAITSSGIIWEYKKRRFRGFSIKDNKRLEEAFVNYNDQKNEGKKPKSRVKIGTKIEVDFEEMRQFKPRECEIRRSFQSGLWAQYMLSPHEQQVHLKINHFQIDNQLPLCVFSTVLAPVPPTKSVAAESIPKPFTELSFIMRKAEHSNIPQIKYFMVLVQEMSVQADKGFINAVIGMFTNEATSTYGVEEYEKDLDITHQTLVQLAAVTSSSEQKAYYEYLHFSPMRIHLSFSQGGDASSDDKDGKGKASPIHSEVLNLLLKSVGVTLTEIQGVQFQLAYLERKAVFMNQQQLINEAISHYTKQVVKQLYVLVLGLDIMGNPFGLIRDLSAGVESFFYEPIQGAIQGPEEFAEGLALGIRGLFGGAVGGAAGAVSRITGTLGKGIAALTLDDEYQKNRQQMLNRRPATVQEGVAQGAKGLAMGFVDGVTGVFSKPIEGAKKGGAAGFAKGVGKGVVGLVTRPVSGIVDFASSSFQAVKRVTGTSDEVKKLRPARFIEPDRIIRPFMLGSAEGNELLKEVSKGGATDAYVAHAPTENKDYYVLVTDHRILMIQKALGGGMDISWECRWSKLAEPPKMTDRGLQVKLKEAQKKVLGIFGGDRAGYVVKFADRQTGEMIAERAKEAFERDQ